MKKVPFSMAISLIAALSAPLMAEVTLSPDKVDMAGLGQSLEVKVLRDGQPVRSAEIRKMIAGVFKTGNAVPEHKTGGTHFSNYSYMFVFSVKDDGVITITPVEDTLQVGQYDFHVYTTHGIARGVIDANLRDSVPPGPQKEIAESMFNFDLVLSEYTYGQAVSIDLEPDSSRHYTWYIDGQVHSSGQGETSFRAWPEPGIHEIAFTAHNAAGVVVSKGSGIAVVKTEEIIAKSVRKGETLTFLAPRGFKGARWSLNGKTLADVQVSRQEQSSQVIKFNKKGKQIVECHLSGDGGADFRRLTWHISVH